MVNEKVTLEEIIVFLGKMGFEKTISLVNNDIVFYYPKPYRKDSSFHYNGIYVKMNKIKNRYFVSMNCYNYSFQDFLENIGDLFNFANNLDEIVLCGKNADLYSSTHLSCHSDFVTEQRKEYFETRYNVFPHVNKEVLGYIEKHSLGPFNTQYQKEVEGKKINQMSREELLQIVSKVI